MSDIAEPTKPSPEGFTNELVWQMYLEEMKKNRQADIAEGNRLADLEKLAGEADGSTISVDAGWPIPEFKHNLGDNPLWDEFMAAMKENRQADIAEANRLADLELEQRNNTRLEEPTSISSRFFHLY